MSIDARIRSVTVHPDGSGALHLDPRPPRRSGERPGIAGQPRLSFDRSPDGVDAATLAMLTGRDIWGGADSVMVGDVEIARRVGYTGLEWRGGDVVRRALSQGGGS